MVSFPSHVPAGGKDIISVQVNTHGFGGKTIQKTIDVFTNDKDNPIVTLAINGEIRKFAHISPANVYLSGEAGSNINAAVEIFPAAKDIFQLVDARADNGTNITYSLQKNEATATGEAYTVHIKNIKQTPGEYRDIIRITTTNPARKELIIPVTGNIHSTRIATISPSNIVRLHGCSGKSVKAQVQIIPKSNHDFNIIKAIADDGKNIRFSLVTAKKNNRTMYVLTLENIRETPGHYKDTIRIATTSDIQKEIVISIVGGIMPAEIVSITPDRLVLDGTIGSTITAEAAIIPEDHNAFEIIEVTPQSGENIKCKLVESTKSGTKCYTLIVENLKNIPGRYHDIVNIKTNNEEMPHIRIHVSAKIRNAY